MAAAHAGWRGLAAGVLQASVSALRLASADPAVEVLAWLGPRIGAAARQRPASDAMRIAWRKR